jgi:DNA-binding response OmpR family regulator/signal transduction histidine kinase
MLAALHRPSVLRRLLLAQGAAVGILVTITTAWTVLAFFRPHSGELHKQLHLTARSMAASVEIAGQRQAHAAGVTLSSLYLENAKPPLHAADLGWMLYARDGTLLARSSNQAPALGLAPTHLAEGGDIDADRWRMVAAWSANGSVLALAGLSPQYLSRVRWAIAESVLMELAMLLATLFAAVAFATRIGLAPLRHFAASLQARQAQDFTPVDSRSVPYELWPFAAAINGLLERLQVQRETEQKFFADAAHELRTPLAVINAQVHQLAMAAGTKHQLQALRALESGVDRAAQTLDKVLALGRAEAGQHGGLRLVSVDLTALLREAVFRQAGRALASHHDLGLTQADNCHVCGDADILRAALDNMLDNALRHTPAGTRVDVRLACDGSDAEISVDDDGPGVPMACRSRVFRRFDAVPAQPPAAAWVWLWSQTPRDCLAAAPGRNGASLAARVSCFAFLKSCGANAQHEGPGMNGLKILLIEDDLALGDAIRGSLAAAGHAPVWVRCLAQGRAQWTAGDAHVVLLDLSLPDGRGLDLLATMRRSGDRLPVIVVTARDAVADRVAALEGGADDYVIKPFATEELLARVGVQLRRAHGLDAHHVRWGTWVLDLSCSTAMRQDQAPCAVTPRELAILRELILAHGRVVERQALVTRVWGFHEQPSDGAIEFQIHALRRKLGADAIRTLRGIGYAAAP